MLVWLVEVSPSGGIVDTIMTLIAERVAIDLEELAIRGDTTDSDPYLALTDGYLKRFHVQCCRCF